jgi:peptidase S24-like protein
VPWIGRIAAGEPILADQSLEDIFPLPRKLVGEGTLFLLKVRGDSMINAAIADGDWVVVRQQEVADDGDIVAALLADGEVTVKTFKRSDGHAWLIPTTRTMRRSSAMRPASSASSSPCCAASISNAMPPVQRLRGRRSLRLAAAASGDFTAALMSVMTSAKIQPWAWLPMVTAQVACPCFSRYRWWYSSAR